MRFADKRNPGRSVKRVFLLFEGKFGGIESERVLAHASKRREKRESEPLL